MIRGAIYRECFGNGLGFQLFRWRVRGKVLAATFVQRNYPDCRAILHETVKPFTKGWQVSFFDGLGAVSDLVRATQEQAIKDAGLAYGYRLESVVCAR